MNTGGFGHPAPPVVSRESIELQRVAGHIAESVRASMPSGYWLNTEADIAPTLLRLVFHYRRGSAPKTLEDIQTVEVDLIAGHPIDDSTWIGALIDHVIELIQSGSSDIIFPKPLDYFRYTNDAGKTVFEQGKAFELQRPKSSGPDGN
jgi:hypothetical protein